MTALEALIAELSAVTDIGAVVDSASTLAIARELLAARKVLEAARELLEVAEMRGDNALPHPADDHKLWSARMQEAWDELERLLRETVPSPEKKP